jgi:pantetheine-phosphate adenylyltransferase
MFPLDKKIEFIEKSVAHFSNVEVDSFEGLTIDYCKKLGHNLY